MIVEVYTSKEKEKHKANITYAFYSAYFNIKGQKGLSGKDLSDILNKIDKPEMDDEDMYRTVLGIHAMLGGET